jgi:hypothetical protein
MKMLQHAAGNARHFSALRPSRALLQQALRSRDSLRLVLRTCAPATLARQRAPTGFSSAASRGAINAWFELCGTIGRTAFYVRR